MQRKQKGQAYHAPDFIMAQDQTSAHQSDACRISKSNLSFEQNCWLSYACHFQIFSQLSRPCEVATGRCANTASGAIHQAINSFLGLHPQLKEIRMSSGSSPEHNSQKATDNPFWRTCPLAHHQITVAACYGHGLRATPRYC